MNVTLTHGKQLAQARKVYTLTLEFMHGDADGDTFKVHTYSEAKVDNLKRDLIGVNVMRYNDNFDSDDFAKAFESHGVENAEKVGELVYENMTEYDIHWEGEKARLRGVKLIYTDEHGVDFDVSYTVG
jgi:hypothetical protein